MAPELGGWRLGSRWAARLQRWGLPVLVVLVWEGVSSLRLVDPALLPPASQVIARGWELLVSGRLPLDLLASGWRVLAGLGLAVALAFPLGILLGLHPRLEAFTGTLQSLLRPLSPPAWIPLAILWFGIGDAPAIFIIWVGTFFALLVGVCSEAKAVDVQLIRAALTLGATRWQSVRHVILPSLLPALLAQLRLGLGLAWMCVIAAEMVAVRRGIGFAMIEARNLFRTQDVIVGMIAIGVVGLGMDGLILGVEHRLCRWRSGLDPARYYARAEPRA